MELRLFANTKIPLSVNVQVYCSLPPPVLISQSNTPTNAFAESAYWSFLSKRTQFRQSRQHPPQARNFAHKRHTYKKLVVPSNICLPTAFPRSYVRIMQPILQILTIFIRKSASPLLYHFHPHYCKQAPIVR